MQHRALCLIALVALAGCQSVQELRALAPQQSDYTICTSLGAANPNLRQAAWEEQQRRGLDCSAYAGAMAASRQADSNSTALGLQLLQASRPQPIYQVPMPTPSVTCVSRNSMGSVLTTCN